MKDTWKTLAVAAAFAVTIILVWDYWLKRAWETLALPSLHHYWYGILLMLGAFALHLLKVDKRIQVFLSTVGLILFGDDLPDFMNSFGVVLTCITIVLLVSMLVVMFKKDRAKSLHLKRKMGKK